MQGISKTRKKGENQTVVQWSATNATTETIIGQITENWKEMPIRGQQIGYPQELTLENTVVCKIGNIYG